MRELKTILLQKIFDISHNRLNILSLTHHKFKHYFNKIKYLFNFIKLSFHFIQQYR